MLAQLSSLEEAQMAERLCRVVGSIPGCDAFKGQM